MSEPLHSVERRGADRPVRAEQAGGWIGQARAYAAALAADGKAPVTEAVEVLVVDDNPDLGIPLAAMLTRSCGWKSTCVHSGPAALAMLAAATPLPRVVLLDVKMPGMDGLDVLRAIRQSPATAMLPVVMFSARCDPDFVEHVKREGATDYWVKSGLDIDELGRRLAEYL